MKRIAALLVLFLPALSFAADCGEVLVNEICLHGTIPATTVSLRVEWGEGPAATRTTETYIDTYQAGGAVGEFWRLWEFSTADTRELCHEAWAIDADGDESVMSNEVCKILNEVPPPPVDSDGDGVPDTDDLCPGTPAGTLVDVDGCPLPTTTPPTNLSVAGGSGVFTLTWDGDATQGDCGTTNFTVTGQSQEIHIPGTADDAIPDLAVDQFHTCTVSDDQSNVSNVSQQFGCRSDGVCRIQ